MVAYLNGTAPAAALALEGTVGRVNDRGFTLAGREGWLNWSKFSVAPVLPDAGDRVLVGLDKAGYVREVTILASTALVSEHADKTPSGEPGRETQIRRMAVLNTAVAALATRGAVDDNTLLTLAARLEAWVLR